MRRALAEAQRVPAGQYRSRRLEDIVDAADDLGEDPLAAAARMSLIDSYRLGGEPARQFAPFTWLLARYDENPDWLTDQDRFTVLWMFKWVTIGMLRFPHVPMDRIRSGIEDMAARFAAAGEGSEPVLAVRFVLAAHLFGHHRAHGEYQEWARTPHTHLSDCPACNQTRQVAHLSAVDRVMEAVRAAEPVLTGELTCDQQPHAVIAKTMEPLWQLGQHDRARREHRRGVCLLRKGSHAFTHADHLLHCARTADLRRGLELYERWVATAVDGSDPARSMRFVTAAARVLTDLAQQGEGDLLVRPVLPANAYAGVPDDVAELVEPGSVAELAVRLTEQAHVLAAHFDRRNGTTTVGDEVHRELATEQVPLSAPLLARVRPTTVTEPADEPPGIGSSTQSWQFSTVQDGLLPEDPESLIEIYLHARERENAERGDAILAHWRQLRQEHQFEHGNDSRTRLATARLDLWTAMDDLADLTLGTAAVLAAIEDALARMRAEGAEQEALLGELGRIHQAAEHGRTSIADTAPIQEKVLSWLRQSGEPQALGRALATTVLMRLRSPSVSGSPSSATAVWTSERDMIREGIEALRSVRIVDLDFQERSALILLLRLSTSGMDDDSAEAILRQCLELVPPPILPTQRALLRADLAGITAGQDPDGAVLLLRSAIADVEPLRRDGLLGRLLGALAQVLRSQGQSLEVVAVLSRAIPLLADVLPQVALEARFDLARVLLERSDFDRAVEVAESLLAEVTSLLEANGEYPVPDITSQEAPASEPSSSVLEHLLFLAGTSAFAAAEAYAGLGDRGRARRMAAFSASWHQRARNPLAEAEAWYLMSLQTGSAERLTHLDHAVTLSELGQDWSREMGYRRKHVTAVHETYGIDAALDAHTGLLDQIDRRVEQLRIGSSVTGEVEVAGAEIGKVRWHRLATVELGARLRAASGRFLGALRDLDGVAEAFRDLGDRHSERDVLGLRGRLLWELGDREAGLDELRRAANQALAHGDQEHAQRFGSDLVTRLDGWGRPEEAEIAWARFGG